MTFRTFIALAIGFVMGFLAANAIHNLIAAGQRSKDKRMLADVRTIADALERFHDAKGHYPPARGEVTGLRADLQPAFLTELPSTDMSGRPYQVLSAGDRLLVICLGRNGVALPLRRPGQ